MSVLYIVMPIAFLLAAVALLGFIWAARQGQFDDLDTPSLRVILDDDTPARSSGTTGRNRPQSPNRVRAGLKIRS
ncbi:MAG: cbb3-type cytochrome oxidase assembly protein CcoS [Phycisphaeraceae bacterium]|nr:cbb3-type cytochrome oxidase assembly protein CcoS [Phycisphaeraceae bacterium]MBX3367329.1 cbb3-type cytochrome oxidase assembly protein CcoS [Phycisphaeraceae bacterium]QYK49319.1 MAG: cbb3-type cytochrome oxidase assembly protein CcoS [Phycisphaeraceae bacterium]